MTKKLLNTKQVAEIIGIDVETLRRWAREGKIEAFKVGRDWMFKEGFKIPAFKKQPKRKE